MFIQHLFRDLLYFSVASEISPPPPRPRLSDTACQRLFLKLILQVVLGEVIDFGFFINLLVIECRTIKGCSGVIRERLSHSSTNSAAVTTLIQNGCHGDSGMIHLTLMGSS